MGCPASQSEQSVQGRRYHLQEQVGIVMMFVDTIAGKGDNLINNASLDVPYHQTPAAQKPQTNWIQIVLEKFYEPILIQSQHHPILKEITFLIPQP